MNCKQSRVERKKMPLTSKFSLTAVLMLLSPLVLAANLQSLDVASLPGERVELKLTFDEAVTAAPRGYTIDQPARIALDLPGVKSQLGERSRELGLGNARSLTVVEANDRTRLIINLTNLAPYTTRVDGNSLFVLVGADSAPGYASASAPVATPAPVPAANPDWRSAEEPAVSSPVAAVSGRAIRSLDFQRGEQGEGNVVVDLSDPSIRVDVQEQGGRVRLNFPNTRLPDELRVRLDVKDFATPVNFINASTSGNDASITIEPSGFYEHLAYQTDNRLIVSFKPLTRTEVERRQADAFSYSGEKLSLNFQNIEVRSVLQLIADFTDLNLVASDTVQGSITLRLQNVPWDQALDLVLRTKGLDKRKVGNVLLVAPADEIAARERQELESQRQIAELAPLRRELIQVNYAKASDIASLFASVTSGDADQQRGSITVDDRTNSIIALETQDKLDELRRIVTQLDIPVRQVMIEARIVEANVGFDKALGVRWGGNLRAGNRFSLFGKDGETGLADDPNPITVPNPGGTGTTQISRTTAGFIGIPERPFNSPFVDMGVLGATSGIGIGFITNNAILDLQLSAMESTGNGEIISQPKVVTSDKETAKILKGSEIPYQEASSSGATTTAFAEAVLSLEVTPQITPDNQVIMEVIVTKDEPDFTNQVNGVPTIRKNEVNAKILVADGETIVIGGVFSSETAVGQEKVPFLGDLPILGRAFRRDITSESKTELLVFLTPRIINNGAITLAR